MQKEIERWIGFVGQHFYSLIYAISTSLSIIVIAKIGQSISPLLSLFVSILFTMIFFHLVSIHRFKETYKKIVSVPSLWMGLSMTVALIWFVSFYGAKEAGGFVFLFVYFITSAIISYIVMLFEKGRISHDKLISALGLIILLILFIDHHIQVLIGIVLAFTGGVSSYFYRRMSQELASKTQLTATQRISVSYFLILMISPIFLSRESYSLLNAQNLLILIGISILSFIIPLYANQKGIQKVGAEHHSIVSATCPLLTYVLQISIDNHWTVFDLVASLLSCFFLILGKIRTKN